MPCPRSFGGRHIPPAHGPQSLLGHHQLPHGPAIGQQTVQIRRQKGVDPLLAPTAGDRPQKFPQPLLLAAFDPEAAAEAHQLPDGRIHHRQGAAQLPVDPLLAAPQGDIAPKPSEGMAAAQPQLGS